MLLKQCQSSNRPQTVTAACELQRRINNKGQKAHISCLSKEFLKSYNRTIPLSLFWLQGRLGNVVFILSNHRHIGNNHKRGEEWMLRWLLPSYWHTTPVLGSFPKDECTPMQKRFILVILHLSFQTYFWSTLPACNLEPDFYELHYLGFLVLWILLVFSKCTSRKPESSRRE